MRARDAQGRVHFHSLCPRENCVPHTWMWGYIIPVQEVAWGAETRPFLATSEDVDFFSPVQVLAWMRKRVPAAFHPPLSLSPSASRHATQVPLQPDISALVEEAQSSSRNEDPAPNQHVKPHLP